MGQGGNQLYAQADLENGAIVWSLDDKNPPKKNGRFKLNFGKNSGQQVVTITLIDNTGKGLRYAPSPIDVQVGGSCSSIGSGVNSTEIVGVSAPSDVLTFTDLNEVECTLVYQLNFVDSSGVPVAPLDPEIRNGGKGGFTVAKAVGGVAGAVAGAILANSLAAEATTSSIAAGIVVGGLIGFVLGGLLGKG